MDSWNFLYKTCVTTRSRLIYAVINFVTKTVKSKTVSRMDNYGLFKNKYFMLNVIQLFKHKMGFITIAGVTGIVIDRNNKNDTRKCNTPVHIRHENITNREMEVYYTLHCELHI